MPQSSLTSWLQKSQVLQKAQLAERSSAQVRDGLATPPLSSNETIPPALQSPVSVPGMSSEKREHGGEFPLPPNVELRACTKDDIPHLKRLNSLLLPIPYPEKFYRDITEDPVTNSITLAAIWHDHATMVGKEKGRLVGAIRGRLLAHPPSSSAPAQRKDGPMLYLSTLILLSPYRSHGIASRMLDILTKRAADDYGVTSVGAHVWESNVDGLEWYRKRGFREVAREQDYYRRLKPSGAMVVQRDVGVMDLVGG